MSAAAGREPFLDIVRRGLRIGAFGGLAFYLVAKLTGNDSLVYGPEPGMEESHYSYVYRFT